MMFYIRDNQFTKIRPPFYLYPSYVHLRTREREREREREKERESNPRGDKGGVWGIQKFALYIRELFWGL